MLEGQHFIQEAAQRPDITAQEKDVRRTEQKQSILTFSRHRVSPDKFLEKDNMEFQ